MTSFELLLQPGTKFRVVRVWGILTGPEVGPDGVLQLSAGGGVETQWERGVEDVVHNPDKSLNVWSEVVP